MLKVLLLFLAIGLTLAKDKQVQEIQTKETKDNVVKIEPYSMKIGNETEKPEIEPYNFTSILRPTPKGKKKCGKCGKRAYCQQKTGRCRCRKGHRGNPYRRCWKIMKCKRKCGKSAYCQKWNGKCRCKWGYTGNPYKGCTKRGCKRKCGKGAYCQRWTGKCRCKWGYKGNPYKGCLDRCKGKCGKGAYCQLWNGKCRCQRGFNGNPYKGCRRNVHWFRVGKATICERRKQIIKCNWRKVINIYHVRYGRNNKHTCKSGPIKTTKCSAKGATGKLRKACNGKRRCALHASNSVFGDPCRGTYKFLRVYYGCRRACSRNGYFKGGRCWCKKGFKGNGYWCTRNKRWRREDEHEVQKSTRPMLPDQESPDNAEIDDVEQARQGKERRSVMGGVPASTRPAGTLPEPDDSEERDERDITDEEEEDHVRVKREDSEDSEDVETKKSDDNVDVKEREVQTKEKMDDDEEEESSDVLTTRDVEDEKPEEMSDEEEDLVTRATDQDTEDTEDEVDVSKRARPYCGKFGKVRGGKCKCNRGFCKNRRGKCVAKGYGMCRCNRGAEKRGRRGRCVCMKGYKRNKKGICV